MNTDHKKTILRSKDMSCPSCVRKIEGELIKLDGVSEAKVFFNTGRIEVRHDPARVAGAALEAAVAKAGYTARVSAL